MTTPKNINQLGARFFHGNHFGTAFPNGASYSNPKLTNHKTQTDYASVEVHFDGIEKIYCDLISSSEVAVGAIAWLTNKAILKALARPKRSAVVVQKEDFLRRDNNTPKFSPWRRELRVCYEKLAGINSFDFEDTYPGQQEHKLDYCEAVQHWLFDASGMFQGSTESVRCIGYASQANHITPKLHHKFLVLGDWSKGLMMHPHTVITGSFNLTENATQSRENIVVINDRNIALAYLSEWAQLWCISESLDWDSPEPHHPHVDMQT